jgi:hypothetical protein
MFRTITAVHVGALVCVSVSAQPVETSDPRKVVSMGCHVDDGICYVALEGTRFVQNASNCSSWGGGAAEVRWDNADKVGKRAYATMMAAMLAGKKVQLSVSGCTVQGAPKLAFFNIIN